MNVTFEQQMYTVVESEGSVAVCAVVLGEFQRPVEVTMFTVDGSAQSKRTNQFPYWAVNYIMWSHQCRWK